MPTYEFTDERGRVLQVEGDRPPNEDELKSVFTQAFLGKPEAGREQPRIPAPRTQASDLGAGVALAAGDAGARNMRGATTEGATTGVAVGQPPSDEARLSEAMATPEEQTLSAKLEKPLVNLPRELYTAPALALFAPRVAEGMAEGTKRAVEGMTSPAGLATLPYMAVGGAEAAALKEAAVAARVIVGAFGVQGASQLPEAGQRYVKAVAAGDQREAASAWVDLAAGSLMALGGVEAVRGVKAALEKPPRLDPLDLPIDHATTLPGATEKFGELLGPEARGVAPESRQLMAPRTPMPEFSQSTLEPEGAPTRALPAPGESGATGGLLPGSPLAEPRAGHRISLPVEPETAARAREVWSKPIDVDAQVTGVEAIKQLATLTEEAKTPGEPYQPPTVNTDLRQLERLMQRNTVSRVESWADEVIADRLKGTSANPFLDPELLAAAAAKGAILFKRGVTKAAEWNAAMHDQFGRGFEDRLPEIYQQSKDYWEQRKTGAIGDPAESAPTTKGVSNARGNEATARSGVSGAPTQALGGEAAKVASPREARSDEGGSPFGVSDRAREQMAETGRVPYTPPGEGTSAWEQIQRGRELIRKGADPDATLADFERTRRVSADDMALVRAKAEALYRASEKVLEARGSRSPEYLATQQRLNSWMERVKPMSTEWHAIGEAQQGMTDVDTGSLVGMEKAHRDATGKGFTPEERVQAEKLTGAVKKERDAVGKAQDAVVKDIDRQTAKAGKGRVPQTAEEALAGAKKAVADLRGGKPTPETANAIWQHAKRSYIEKGEANIDAIAQGVADDLGLPKRTVMELMTSNKSTRVLTDDMYLKMARARQAEAAARQWLVNAQSPGWLNALRKVPALWFAKATFGHGTIGMVTHAGSLMFDARVAGTYWTNFARQYKLMLNEGYHEAMMQDLMHRPNFVAAKRAGLANDPFRFQDDYSNPQIMLALGKWTRAGQHGFDVLKLLRQDLFDRSWERTDALRRTPEMAQVLANEINHATGVVKGNAGVLQGALNTGLFAPKLEGSRWMFLIGDPAKATEIALRWVRGKEVSPTEKAMVMGQVMQKASIAGTYLSLLAVNQGLLSAFGSEQSVNFTEPGRGDFLAFKMFGKNVNAISPMLRLVGFLAHLVQLSAVDRTRFQQATTSRAGAMSEAAGKYARGKLSPFASTATDLVTQSDYSGRPLPFSDDHASKRLRREGLDTYTWGEYLWATQTPIPVEEAVREVWASQGMDDAAIKTALKALGVFGVTGGTGVRMSDDFNEGR